MLCSVLAYLTRINCAINPLTDIGKVDSIQENLGNDFVSK